MWLFGYIFTAVLVLAAAAPSMACYGGLILIPTADVVGAGQYSLEVQVDGSLAERNADTRFFNSQFGFGDKFEAGVDFDFSPESDSRTLFNAKYVFAAFDKQSLLIAGGVHSLEPGIESVPYVVATKSFGKVRIHLGGHHNNGANHWFAGIDHAVNDRWTLMADHTAGDEDYSSVGFNYQVDDRFGIMAGALFPNEEGDTLYTVHLVYGGYY